MFLGAAKVELTNQVKKGDFSLLSCYAQITYINPMVMDKLPFTVRYDFYGIMP